LPLRTPVWRILRQLGGSEQRPTTRAQGLFGAPPERRTWAPRDRTPVLTIRNAPAMSQDAIAKYSQAVQINPDLANARYNRGLALGNQESRKPSTRRPYASNPSRRTCTTSRAGPLSWKGKLEEAKTPRGCREARANFQPARSALDDLRRREAKPRRRYPARARRLGSEQGAQSP